ncbi:MAG TPA: RsmG family class I SAM-dependent methyltransferase [Vicinamibacterales bacterium]|nr:RsmG family class I SAM-dependent methyltransferase [Vicinamibacterales bacterium]
MSAAVAEQLASFVGLLAKWNATLNLTGFPLDPPSDEALNRLLIEPLAAAPLIPAHVKVAIDVGSGGGSPAIPLKLLRPVIQFILVESKTRKGAFLREAVRHLELGGVAVESSRFDALASRPEFQATADLLTVRAVRLDDEFWMPAATVLRRGGHVLLFGTQEAAPSLPPGFESAQSVQVQGTTAVITLARRA